LWKYADERDTNDHQAITATEWGTKAFYVEDPDGYIIGFGGRPAAG
jgi:hypothetical protein